MCRMTVHSPNLDFPISIQVRFGSGQEGTVGYVHSVPKPSGYGPPFENVRVTDFVDRDKRSMLLVVRDLQIINALKNHTSPRPLIVGFGPGGKPVHHQSAERQQQQARKEELSQYDSFFFGLCQNSPLFGDI